MLLCAISALLRSNTPNPICRWKGAVLYVLFIGVLRALNIRFWRERRANQKVARNVVDLENIKYIWRLRRAQVRMINITSQPGYYNVITCTTPSDFLNVLIVFVFPLQNDWIPGEGWSSKIESIFLGSLGLTDCHTENAEILQFIFKKRRFHF